MLGLHLAFAWVWFLAGAVAGATAGLFFHREAWLGGYASWTRRLTRLGHVAFFGTGFLNLAFALSIPAMTGPAAMTKAASTLLLVGAVLMPAVCYAAAWRASLRHLFPIPVACLIAGIALSAVLVLR